MKKHKKRVVVTATQFVTAFMSSTSYKELAKKLGKSVQYTQHQASSYRKKGVRLPKFARAGTNASIDVRALNGLIRETRKGL